MTAFLWGCAAGAVGCLLVALACDYAVAAEERWQRHLERQRRRAIRRLEAQSER